VKVLLDENLPHGLRASLRGHDVSTVAYLGWAGVKNGDLLLMAEKAGFDVLVTGDRNLAYQQNLKNRKIAIIELTAQHWLILREYIPAISAAVDLAEPGSFQVVQCGEFRRE
jgi:hypothetical protein